jgi:hypothetical protein
MNTGNSAAIVTLLFTDIGWLERGSLGAPPRSLTIVMKR